MTHYDDTINTILCRLPIINNIKQILNSFDDLCKDISQKRGIYIYGPSAIGKTYMIEQLLLEMNYDTIIYNSSDTRNKTLFKSINNNNLSNHNVVDLMNNRIKKIAIIMDEIDGMHTGDRGSMESLIKLIRPKKTKKQKMEDTIAVPIICIGNNKNDKKIRELIKACYSFEITPPSVQQINQLLKKYIPTIFNESSELIHCVLNYIQNDLRNLYFICNLWKENPNLFKPNIIQNIFHTKNSNDDAKTITSKLYNNSFAFIEHQYFMNETDRTTVALLWHENIPIILKHEPIHKFISFYLNILSNICYADYISRITFQSQIWQFNEMCSIIKTFDNNRLYHEQFTNNKLIENKLIENKLITSSDIEFTKVLTKYSTEYNNQEFINRLCQKLNMDKNDLFCFFKELKLIFELPIINTKKLKKKDKPKDWTITVHLFLKGTIELLDIKRMYRFLEKNVSKNDDDDDDFSVYDNSISSNDIDEYYNES